MGGHPILGAAKRAAAWLLLAAGALSAEAGGLGVHPIRVGLSAAAPTAAITLRNHGTSPMVLQLQLTRWTAEAGEDRHEPSGDLLATPPVFSLAPGASQIVRVGLGQAPDAQREGAYRLFIEEVPPPPGAGYQGLRVALRIGVPVFVQALQPARPALQWSAVRAGADGVVIRARNAGTAHGRVLAITLRAPGQDRVLSTQAAAGYLLPGQERAWTLRTDAPWAGDRLRMTATTEQGAADAELDLRNP